MELPLTQGLWRNETGHLMKREIKFSDNLSTFLIALCKSQKATETDMSSKALEEFKMCKHTSIKAAARTYAIPDVTLG